MTRTDQTALRAPRLAAVFGRGRLVAVLGALLACSDPTAKDGGPTTTALPTARVDATPLRSLQRSELWDWSPTLFALPGLVLDSTGVPYITLGGKPSRHPVSIATVAILMLSNAEVTGNRATRDTVELWAHRVIAEMDTTDASIIFPYGFDYALHGFAADEMPAPWYSALAQGEWLELLVRLHQLTGKPEYRAWADKVFAPFLDVRPSTVNARAIAHVDALGFYWADEYPNRDRSDLTLNGYMYAMRGVYEYWQLTKRPEAERVLQASFATLKHYALSYRNVGNISSYCLRHPQVLSAEYHVQHVLLFRDFYKMSGDPFFSAMADDLQSDYWQ